MTKLEKKRNEFVISIDDCCGTSDIYIAAEKSWDAAIAELMPQVQMLVGALEEITKPYKDFGLGCFHEEIARHALTEWREYVEGDRTINPEDVKLHDDLKALNDKYGDKK
jgi:hypothetical protein